MMASFKRNKSGGSQSEGASNSASPASSVALSNPGSTPGINNNAPKYGTLVPNRIFVGGISSNTTEAELSLLFSKYGNVKATKIIADRAGVSKGYGFVTFETEEEVKLLLQDANNIVFKERRLNIASAIKKQPSGRYDSTSPPPTTTPILHLSNGVPYTLHNGMAFFHTAPHQPALAALPPAADHSMYQSYAPAQNSAPAPYGHPVIVPGTPFLIPQNYSYQPLSMANGAATQFIYAGSGSPNSNSGSPMANASENQHPHHPLPPPFFAPPYATPEAFFPHPYYVGYASSLYSNEYEGQDQNTNDDCSSTASSPRSETSERSSNRSIRSPANIVNIPRLNRARAQSQNREPTNSPRPNPPSTPNSSNDQVPVVSWKNNYSEEKEIYIRDGRRAFYPTSSQPAQMMPVFHQPQFPYQSRPVDNSRNQRYYSNSRPSRLYNPNLPPYIPKFPKCFNNNNPSEINKNYRDKSTGEPKLGNSRGSGHVTPRSNNSSNSSPIPSPKPNPSNPSPPQMMGAQNQGYERPATYVMAANSAPRWASGAPQNSTHQIKRIATNKQKQNGSNSNQGGGPGNSTRMTKKPQGGGDGTDSDIGGGGDAQISINSSAASNADITSKMQSVALASS